MSTAKKEKKEKKDKGAEKKNKEKTAATAEEKKKKEEKREEPESSEEEASEVFRPNENPDAIQVFGVSYSGDRMHLVGNVPDCVVGIVRKFCKDRQKDGNKQIQFLQSAADDSWLGGSEYIVTKCEDNNFFRLHVALSRAVLREGWTKFDDQKYGGHSGVQNNMTSWMKDPSKAH
ncbi:ATP-dependent RNA helicase DBP3 [Balamuthia mandrillaris]